MNDKDGNGGNRTVFRPSPLQGLNANKGPQPQQPQAPAPGGASPFAPSPPAQARAVAALPTDDIPLPEAAQMVRNLLLAEAAPVLALAASVRAGRTRPPLPQFHRIAQAAIARFEKAIQPGLDNETYQRARYAVCATVDDIAQNLPGMTNDTAEWARRSMVVTFFHENIGGDRFWQLTDDMLGRPQQNMNLIELFHACLAAGFEGRFRVMPDGKRRLQEIMTQLYACLDFPRSLSTRELVPHWRGETAPMAKVGFWNYIAMAGAIAFGVLMLIYIILRLILLQTGHPSWDAMGALIPAERLRLSREAAAPPPPPAGGQLQTLQAFLKPEIDQGLVKVEEDATTVRVRTTVGQLFKPGSDELEPDRVDLFNRIGKAVDSQPGPITVEGHADSDKISTLQFPDNMALSGARANTVAGLLAKNLSDPSRISAQAFGDTEPIAPNSTPDGKALNRRVEVVIQRQN